MNKHLACLIATALTTSMTCAAETRTVTLEVTKMDCAACPITVRKILEKVPGVASARVDLQAKQAVVVFDPAKAAPQALTRATAEAGFPSTIKQLR